MDAIEILISGAGLGLALFFYGLAGLSDAVGQVAPVLTGQPAREAAFLLNEGGPVATRAVYRRMSVLA